MGRKETTLYVRWSKKEKDFMFHFPSSKTDGHLMHWFINGRTDKEFSKSLSEELVARGYDLTTLKFSIKKKEKSL